MTEVEDAIQRLDQEAELAALHHIIAMPGISGAAVTTDFPASKTIATREIAIGPARDVRCLAIREPFAYVGVANGGIAVVDLTDPVNATVVGGIRIPGCEPTSIAIAGDMLYVADLAAGFHALDLSADPRRPVHTASLPALVHTANRRVLVSGRTLVLVNDHAFSVYDLGDPRRPVPVAFRHRQRSGVGFFHGAAFLGPTLYLTQGALGLWTFDLSVSSRPRPIAGQAVALDSRPTEKLVADALAVYGQHLFVGTRMGVWSLRLRDGAPAEPEAFFTGPGYIRETAQGEAREGHLLFGVFEPFDHAYYVFDVTQTARYLGRQRLTRAVDRVYGFQRTRNVTLVAAGTGGLLVTVP